MLSAEAPRLYIFMRTFASVDGVPFDSLFTVADSGIDIPFSPWRVMAAEITADFPAAAREVNSFSRWPLWDQKLCL
jgi:hypothetical protein